MRIAFFCNALDSSSALFNIFSHVCARLRRNEGAVLHRDSANWHLSSAKYDLLVYDSAFCLALVHSKLGRPEKYRHVVLHHIYESVSQRTTKEGWLKSCAPDLVITTFSGMADDVHEHLGLRAEVIPFSFDTARFTHLPYPDTFTVGYLGADKSHKGFDQVDAACKTLNIPCVGARRTSHEDGPYARREPDFYRQISCYAAIPSHESGPLPPIEAQLCGRPAVVSPVGMMPYIFSLGAGGALAEAEDSLVAGLVAVRDNFEEHARKAREFTLPDTSEQYESAFERVL